MKIIFKPALVFAAMISTPAISLGVTVIFNETFEDYPLGDIDGQGGWVDFGGLSPTEIVDTRSSGGNQSISFSTVASSDNQYGSDSSFDLPAPITSGKLKLTFDLFIPASFDGNANIFLSRGETLAGNFDQGLFFIGEGALGTFKNSGSSSVTLVLDQWVRVFANVDLDENTATATYNDTEFFTGAWNNGGVTANQFQGINIWASGPGGVEEEFNIDNLRLEAVPEPSGLALFGLVTLTFVLKRRRTSQ